MEKIDVVTQAELIIQKYTKKSDSSVSCKTKYLFCYALICLAFVFLMLSTYSFLKSFFI